MYSNTVISSLFIAAIAVLAWTFFLSQNSVVPQSTRDDHQPDSFMQDVHAIVMDKFGRPSLKIVTPQMIHFAQNDTSVLTTPILTLYRNSPEPWYITSNIAYVTNSANNVEFKQNVLIQHAADNAHPATVIKTDTLMVHPNQKTADTADAITLMQPDAVVVGIGMHADLNTGDIHLLTRARGEYVPHH